MSLPRLPRFQRVLRKRPHLRVGGEAITHHLRPDRLDPPHELWPERLDRLEYRENFRDVGWQLAIDLGYVRMNLVLLRLRDPARVEYHVGELRSALDAAPDYKLVVVAAVELRGCGLEARGLRPVIFRAHARSFRMSVGRAVAGSTTYCSNSSIRLILISLVLAVNRWPAMPESAIKGAAVSTTLITGAPHSHPLYTEVRGEITRGLAGGEWKPGDLIPSEADLAKRFGVSKGTIRHALDELVAGRILVRRQGRGTFVATHSRDRTLYHFFHLIGRDGTRELPETELLSYRVIRGSDEACDTLDIDRQSKFVSVRNLVKLGGEPVVIDEILIPQASVPGLTESMYASRESTIYALYQSRFNINVIRISERLGAGPAPAQHAKLLGIRVNAPLLVIDRVAFTYHDKPVELRKSWVTTEKYVYHSDLRKN